MLIEIPFTDEAVNKLIKIGFMPQDSKPEVANSIMVATARRQFNYSNNYPIPNITVDDIVACMMLSNDLACEYMKGTGIRVNTAFIRFHPMEV